MRSRLLWVIGSILCVAACAKRAPLPIPITDDYLFPTPAAGELSTRQWHDLRLAWQDVLVGDAVAAERRLVKLRRQAPGRASLETASGFARLRASQVDLAEAAFARALEAAPAYAPALVGAGSAALRRGDADLAFDRYRRALETAPEEPAVRRRVAALKLQVTDRHVGLAQARAAEGDLAAAAEEYRLALAAAPEVAGVRLELAELLIRAGDSTAARDALEEDPTQDRQVALRLGGLLLENGNYLRASTVFEGLLARDPADAAARDGQKAAREAHEAAVMPEEYRRIPSAARLTRAELAALLMARIKRLRTLLPGVPRLAVDIAGSWASEPIAQALALDVVDVYPNHTFQPQALVRRVDLARALARVLDRLGWPPAPQAAAPPSDMTRSHLDYLAVQRVLSSGLMELSADGAFEPWKPVTGQEAVEVVEAATRLVGP